MKILIWPGHHDPLDALIKFFTHGRGAHAAFLRGDGRTIHEAFMPALRDRSLDPADRRWAEVFEVAGVTRQQHAQFERLFDYNLQRHIRYSLGDLLRFALNCPCRDEHHTFCSRYVLYCLHAILADEQMPLVRLPFGDWASPRDLRISPRLRLLEHYFA